MKVNDEKSSEIKRESRDSRINNSTVQKLPPHTTQFYKLFFFVRFDRFRFEASKSEGTTAVSIYFCQAEDYLLSVKPNLRVSLLKS